MVSLEEKNELQAVASIDFDSLSSSGKPLSKLIGLMFSGTHTLTVKGQLISKGGKANFSSDQARFDDTTLPRYLVEQIITAVGRKQNPPFDPLGIYYCVSVGGAFGGVRFRSCSANREI